MHAIPLTLRPQHTCYEIRTNCGHCAEDLANVEFVQDGGLSGGVQPQHHNLQRDQAASTAALHRLRCGSAGTSRLRKAGGRPAHSYCISPSLARMSRVPHILSNSFFREFPMAAERV